MPLYKDINTPEFKRLDFQAKKPNFIESALRIPFSFSATELHDQKNIPPGL